MRMTRSLLALALLIGTGTFSWAQEGKKQTREGNRLFDQQLYEEAREKYSEGLQVAPDSPLIKYNLGDADYKLEKFQDAVSAYNEALSADDEQLKAQALYNLGNAYYRLGKFQESSEAYKDALRVNPDDREAKFNLEKALRQLQMNPPQQSQNQDKKDSKDKDDQEKSDGSSQSGQKQESNKDAQQQQQDSPQQQEDQDRPEQNRDDSQKSEEDVKGNNSQSPQSGSPEDQQEDQSEGAAEPSEAQQLPLTKEQAEQLLAALKENQKDFLKKRVVPAKPRVGDKDW